MGTEERDEKNRSESLCIECRQTIPAGSRICSYCKSYQSKLKNQIRYWGLLIGFLAALGTAAVHTVALWPKAMGVLYPTVSLNVLEFKSNRRLTLANNGDHDVFISFVHYRSHEFPYENVAKELMAQAKDKPIEDLRLEVQTEMDPFDTNQEIGITIQPGAIVEHKFDAEIPEGLSFVHGKGEQEWQRIVLIAGLNKKSQCIRPVFLSVNDRRLIQIRRGFGDSLNTFPSIGVLHVYSPRLKRSLEVPFDIVGTVVIRAGECEKQINRWVNPRRGHISDLE